MPTKTTKSPTKAKTPKKEPAKPPQEALDETYNADGEIDDAIAQSEVGEISGAPAADVKKAAAESQTESPADRLKELEDKFIRLRAEYDNFMKRTAREKYQLAAFGGQSVVRAVLPVLDDLQRLIDHAREAKSGSDDALLTGAEMVLGKFVRTLESEGVHRIDAVGKKFDPLLHDAMLRQPSEEHEGGMVIEEYEPGYTYRDKVIRHAKVVVSE